MELAQRRFRSTPDPSLRLKSGSGRDDAVLVHDDVADHDEAVTLPRLFEDGEESVPCSRGTKERQSPPTPASDKVQVMCAERAMQTRRHDRTMVSAASYPPLQKTQGRGTHSFEMGNKKRTERPGHPSSGSRSEHSRIVLNGGRCAAIEAGRKTGRNGDGRAPLFSPDLGVLNPFRCGTRHCSWQTPTSAASIPALAKIARAGAPTISKWMKKRESSGPPVRSQQNVANAPSVS